MSTPKQHPYQAKLDAWQPSLGLVFPRKPMLRPDEVAGPLGVDLRTVSRLFEVDAFTVTPEGRKRRPWLMGLEFNAGTKGERDTRRIPRDAAILFYALSANFEPAELLGLLFDVLDARTDAELLAVIQRAQAILKARA